jgi:hypothetical protein
MRNILILLLIFIALSLAVPLVEQHYESEKAFTSDNLICTTQFNM